ncbi:hypothetical protein [Mycoplasma tauri]|nr:hypothetical protein [Mycoplasma tauri]MBZ4204460.1 hypothetical protein [Mycoplasma tauri]
MNTLIKKISEIFNIEENEILEKLNLKQESNSKEIAKSLGVYGLFETKEELSDYIVLKVQNKQKEIDALNKTSEQLSNELNSMKENNAELKTFKDNQITKIKE